MADSDPIALFTQVAKSLNVFKLAYLHIAEAVKPRRLFGQLFIANPALPQRFKENQSLNVPEVATIYSVGLHGYTDYPELSASR